MKQALKKAADSVIQTWHDSNVYIFNLNNIGMLYRTKDTSDKTKRNFYQPFHAHGRTSNYTAIVETYDGNRSQRSALVGNGISNWTRLVWFHIGEVLNPIIDRVKTKKKCSLFKDAIIYRPTDESMLKLIHKSISSFRCTAAVRYMDKLNFDDEQKAMVIDSLLQEMKQTPQLNLVTC